MSVFNVLTFRSVSPTRSHWQELFLEGGSEIPALGTPVRSSQMLLENPSSTAKIKKEYNLFLSNNIIIIIITKKFREFPCDTVG